MSALSRFQVTWLGGGKHSVPLFSLCSTVYSISPWPAAVSRSKNLRDGYYCSRVFIRLFMNYEHCVFVFSYCFSVFSENPISIVGPIVWSCKRLDPGRFSRTIVFGLSLWTHFERFLSFKRLYKSFVAFGFNENRSWTWRRC